MRTVLLVLGLLLVSLPSADAADVAITTCGTVVASGDTGTLAANLDCSSAPASQPAVVLQNRSALSLGGFTVTGAADGIGVRCSRNCTVKGPGTITSVPAGPGSLRAACIRAVLDAGAPPRSQRLNVEDLSLTGCGTGVLGDTGSLGLKLTVKNVVADGNDVGFMAASIRARDVSANNGNGAGFLVPTGKMIGVNIHADDNDPVGVAAARMSLADSTATGNVAFGVQALVGTAKLLRTTVTGSGIRDVLSVKRPQVSSLTCDTSGRWIPPNGIGEPWGVCSGD